MLHLIFCSLSSLTCGENIFIKVSVVGLLLSGCQVCPILYFSGERVCTLQPGLLASQLGTGLHPSKKSICILILNSNFKKLSNLRDSWLWTLIDSKNTGKFPVYFPLLSSNINFNCKFSIELKSDSDVKICHLSLQEACQLGKITSVNVSAKHFFCSFLHVHIYQHECCPIKHLFGLLLYFTANKLTLSANVNTWVNITDVKNCCLFQHNNYLLCAIRVKHTSLTNVWRSLSDAHSSTILFFNCTGVPLY